MVIKLNLSQVFISIVSGSCPHGILQLLLVITSKVTEMGMQLRFCRSVFKRQQHSGKKQCLLSLFLLVTSFVDVKGNCEDTSYEKSNSNFSLSLLVTSLALEISCPVLAPLTSNTPSSQKGFKHDSIYQSIFQLKKKTVLNCDKLHQ